MTATLERKPDTNKIRETGRNVPAAIALLLAVTAILVAEATAAAAWDSPAYSYADDFVSDLGVPGPPVMFKGHMIHSPLSAVLNAGFIVNGALVALAAALLLRNRGEARMARWQFRMLMGYSLGLLIAAVLHESPAWSLPFHAVGAALIMCCGNIAVLLTGRLGVRLGLPTSLARLFTALGAFGLASFIALQVLVTVDATTLPHNIGTLERMAAYPILLAQIAAGVGLLAESGRLRRRHFALPR